MPAHLISPPGSSIRGALVRAAEGFDLPGVGVPVHKEPAGMLDGKAPMKNREKEVNARPSAALGAPSSFHAFFQAEDDIDPVGGVCW